MMIDIRLIGRMLMRLTASFFCPIKICMGLFSALNRDIFKQESSGLYETNNASAWIFSSCGKIYTIGWKKPCVLWPEGMDG